VTTFRGASRHRKQPWPEYKAVADHVDRFRLPRAIFPAQPPLAALPVCNLGRVLAEHHPVKAFLPCVWAVTHPVTPKTARRRMPFAALDTRAEARRLSASHPNSESRRIEAAVPFTFRSCPTCRATRTTAPPTFSAALIRLRCISFAGRQVNGCKEAQVAEAVRHDSCLARRDQSDRKIIRCSPDLPQRIRPYCATAAAEADHCSRGSRRVLHRAIAANGSRPRPPNAVGLCEP